MRIIQAIDHLFDTYEKRRDWVFLVLLGYWGWQILWLMLLMLQVFRVQDQSSLIALMDTMGGYDTSLFVRIAFSILNYAPIYRAFHLLDWIAIFSSLFLFIVFHTKTFWFLGGSLLVVIGYIAVLLFFGLHIANLNQLFQLLRFLSIGSVILSSLYIILSLFFILQVILEIGNCQ